MPNPRLLFPDTVIDEIRKRQGRRYGIWLSGAQEWPVTIDLGCPTEEEASRSKDLVQTWIASWRQWSGKAELQWQTRHWRQIGKQDLPHKLVFKEPAGLADMLGDGERWRCAERRYEQLRVRWPMLQHRLSEFFDVLAGYEEMDYSRLQNLVAWFCDNPNSNLYPRQIPVDGLDTKWFETRTHIVQALVSTILLETAPDNNFAKGFGLRTPPDLYRIRLLDPDLSKQIGGLGDITAPLEDLAALSIRPQCAFIVENLQTFLSFEQLSRSAVLLGMGYRAPKICALPWLGSASCYYWGDLDTHGLAILSMVRARIPRLRSLFMDHQTLIRHKALWSIEKKQNSAEAPEHLDDDELAVYQALRSQYHGPNVRLEQERLPWDAVWETIQNLPTD